MLEIVEVFTCPGCGAEAYVLWKPEESEREIPCPACYHEERMIEITKTEWSEEKQENVAVAMREIVLPHGRRIRVQKGQGVILVRNDRTRIPEPR